MKYFTLHKENAFLKYIKYQQHRFLWLHYDAPCGMGPVQWCAEWAYQRPWIIRIREHRVRKCTATTSLRIDRIRNCTVITFTGIQSPAGPARNTHANEQSQSAEFYVTYKEQKSWSPVCFTASTLYTA